MPGWSWWLIFGGIALLAALVLGGLGLGLWRRAKPLLADLDRLSSLASSLSTTLGGIDAAPPHPATPAPGRHRG
jgi:hypothetical protein